MRAVNFRVPLAPRDQTALRAVVPVSKSVALRFRRATKTLRVRWCNDSWTTIFVCAATHKNDDECLTLCLVQCMTEPGQWIAGKLVGSVWVNGEMDKLTRLIPGPDPDICASSMGSISSRWNRIAKWISVWPTSNAEFLFNRATSVLVNERPGLPPHDKYASTALKLFSTTPERKENADGVSENSLPWEPGRDWQTLTDARRQPLPIGLPSQLPQSTLL